MGNCGCFVLFYFSRMVSRKYLPPRNHICKQRGLLDTHLAGIIQCLCLAEGGAPQLEVGLQPPSTTSVYIYIYTYVHHISSNILHIHHTGSYWRPIGIKLASINLQNHPSFPNIVFPPLSGDHFPTVF